MKNWVKIVGLFLGVLSLGIKTIENNPFVDIVQAYIGKGLLIEPEPKQIQKYVDKIDKANNSNVLLELESALQASAPRESCGIFVMENIINARYGIIPQDRGPLFVADYRQDQTFSIITELHQALYNPKNKHLTHAVSEEAFFKAFKGIEDFYVVEGGYDLDNNNQMTSWKMKPDFDRNGFNNIGFPEEYQKDNPFAMVDYLVSILRLKDNKLQPYLISMVVWLGASVLLDQGGAGGHYVSLTLVGDRTKRVYILQDSLPPHGEEIFDFVRRLEAKLQNKREPNVKNYTFKSSSRGLINYKGEDINANKFTQDWDRLSGAKEDMNVEANPQHSLQVTSRPNMFSNPQMFGTHLRWDGLHMTRIEAIKHWTKQPDGTVSSPVITLNPRYVQSMEQPRSTSSVQQAQKNIYDEVRSAFLNQLLLEERNPQFGGFARYSAQFLYEHIILPALKKCEKPQEGQDKVSLWQRIKTEVLFSRMIEKDKKLEVLRGLHAALYHASRQLDNMQLDYIILDEPNFEKDFLAQMIENFHPVPAFQPYELQEPVYEFQSSVPADVSLQNLKEALKEKILTFQGWKNRHNDLLAWADNLTEEDLKVDDDFEQLSQVIFNDGILIANNGQKKLKTWLNELVVRFELGRFKI